MSWNQFAAQLPTVAQAAQGSSDNEDVVTTTSTAPRVRSAEELSARIKANGGAITVSASDSDYIVAVNNSLRFSITRAANNQFIIRESQSLWLLIGLGVAMAAVLILRK